MASSPHPAKILAAMQATYTVEKAVTVTAVAIGNRSVAAASNATQQELQLCVSRESEAALT
jgi:hypothetical protein